MSIETNRRNESFWTEGRRSRVADADGFVLPLAVFGIVLMTTIAVASLLMAADERRSSSAMRQSSTAFYAAEAGINQLYAVWDTHLPALDSLAPGDSLDLGWQDLNATSSYRTIIRRTDTGGQRMFAVQVEGRANGQLGGRKVLTMVVTSLAGVDYSIGECCEAAVTIRGNVELEDTASVSGFDQVPADWDSVCPPAEDDKPGLLMQDTLNLEIEQQAWVEGSPPVRQDASIDDATFDLLGDLTWTELKGLADHTLSYPGTKDDLSGDIYPRYNADGSCDTSHPFNWGSKDPNDPCFDYFPVIIIEGGVEINYSYGQAIIIIEWDDSAPPGEKGGEFDLGTGTEFNGIILGKGCVEIEEGAIFHGAVFVDAKYRNEQLCYHDKDFAMNENQAEVHFSRCAIDRAIGNSSLEDEVSGGLGRATFLPSRSFGELFQ